MTKTRDCDCDSLPDPLLPIEEAQARIEAEVAPVGETEIVPLAQAAGRVLAEEVCARALTPPFDNSAMDGYAVKLVDFAGEGPWTLPVTGRVLAGSVPPARFDGAVQVLTGAPVPEGTDAVVMQEHVTREGDAITLTAAPEPRANIRRAGGDMAPGDRLLSPGTRLGAREIAAAAAGGHGALRVRRRVRVAFLISGDELRPAGEPLEGAQIWDVNNPALAAALHRPDVEVTQMVHGADTAEATRAALMRLSAEADLIITSGGVSVGVADHVKPEFLALGGALLFSKVSIKPGKPVSLGRLRDSYWLGLPGNPFSALATYTLFGRQIVARLTGAAFDPGVRPVVLAQALRHKPGRAELRLARLTGFDEAGRALAEPASATHSHRVATLSDADGMLMIPAEVAELEAGKMLNFLPFGDL
ncbi:MAG: molybdopterin molybdenumtransferase MoeA [Rhodobacterales bacterium]|nr:MAG: molybdopterin molybdenumtransferase MoeA [Rhodobacterales bacterium]